MHPYDIMVVISIACCVGFSLAIYEDRDPVLVIGYFAGSTMGAFAGGYLALWGFPEYGKFGIIFGGLLGAVVLVTLWRVMRKRQ